MASRTGHVYAVDIQIDLLRRLKMEAMNKNLHNIEILIADLDTANSTKLRDNSADWVYVCNILFILKDKKVIIKEASRILKPGGRLLIVDWKESFGGMGPQPEYVINDITAKQLATEAGFVIDREIPAGEHHYGLIFKK